MTLGVAQDISRGVARRRTTLHRLLYPPCTQALSLEFVVKTRKVPRTASMWPRALRWNACLGPLEPLVLRDAAPSFLWQVEDVASEKQRPTPLAFSLLFGSAL